MRTFSIDPNRLEAIISASDALHASYRELSREQQDLSERLVIQRNAREERLGKLRISETQVDGSGNRVPRDAVPEDAAVLDLTAKLQAVKTRMARASSEATHAGRLANAAQEYADSLNGRRVPRYASLLGAV